MELIIPKSLAATCGRKEERVAWLERLPAVVEELAGRWSLVEIARPFDGQEVSCAWVAPVRRRHGTPAVLKLGMPHMEAEQEIAGLRFWNGDPTVRLLEADEGYNAMLLEQCRPGTVLRTLPEPEQDVIMAGLLRRLWRLPAEPHPFRPLAEMTAYWAECTEEEEELWPDAGLVRAGLALFYELPRTAPTEALLATDLHAGNVLRAEREPWLVIDPKPFIGDPAYDATQHLYNCLPRVLADPDGVIGRFAELLGLDYERVRLWMFARMAAESRDDWGETEAWKLAVRIAP
jgi:streptomycin 6-kinase